MNRGGRAEVTPPENLIAVEMFDHFCAAGTMKQILALHREICHTLTLVPNRLPEYYPKLKDKLARSWKAQALFKKFDARANHKVYAKGRAGAASKVLIIGAGPCGLRAAIECQLLGAKVVVIEKRDRMSRNNVLHLWPFVIEDLRALGAKKFFGKFCAGSIDHISIRQLQCILLKVALLLGVEFHEGVSFEGLLEPTITENSDTLGWRASVTPSHQPVSQYEFDVLLGADGKRNTLHGFQRKEFRGKLAMAITANFINRNTEQEAAVPEINGVAFIFNQKFFKDLYEQTGIDLENIVYYKDDTHYFVMTAKKHSLLDKGVLLNDYSEVSRLLSVRNVDREALMRYAREAARFSTEGRLPLRDFALNHYGEPDVALFDFTSMYMAINASMVRERLGRRLLCQLVGDSLLEPFWPTGSGCARGFLSALDAVWAVRSWSQSPPPHPLELIAERESTYRLLAQTTVENLNRELSAYTLDPCTRYRNLNRATVSPHQVTAFYVSDDPLPLDETPSVRKRRRDAAVSDDALLAWMGGACGDFRAAVTPAALAALLRRYRPDLLPAGAAPRAVFAVIQHEFGLPQLSAGRSPGDVPEAELRSYLARLYDAFKGEVPHVYHPSDVFDQIKEKESKQKASRSAILTPSMFSNTSDAEKSHSSTRKKRRAVRQVSVIEDIRDMQGQLHLCNMSNVPVNEMSSISISDVSYESFKTNLNDSSKIPGDQMSPLSNEANNPGSEMFNASTNDLSGREMSTMSISEVSKFSALFENQCSPLVKVNRIVDFSDIPSNQSIQFQGNGSSTPKHNQWPKADLDDYFEVLFAEPVRPARKPKKVRKISPRQLNYYSDILKMSPGPVGEILQISTPDSNDVSPPKKIVSTPASCTPKRLRRPSDAREGTFGRSNSIGSLDVSSGDRAPVLDRRFSQDSRSRRSGSVSDLEMAIRRRRFWELIEGKQSETPNPRFKSPVTCGTPVAVRIERVANLLVPKSPDRPKYSTRRRASREMRQQIERAQKLAALPQEVIPSADLENDYGLQQYRANAPHFGDRVKDLQMKLQHHEEGRIVGGGGRSIGTGDRVARLAAELSGNATSPAATPRVASKPKDLMRSVGKIERDDWNVKKIENKIMENRLGRPEPKSAEKVPKWDREQFLGRQRRLKEGDGGDEKWGEIDEALLKFDQKRRDSGRPAHGTKKVASLATKFVKKDEPENTAPQPKEELKKSWRGPASTGVRCAACGARVFAAEGVLADGLHLHRACFRCAVCKAVLRPGNYTTERNGTRLVCLRHGGVSVPDAAALAGAPLPPPTPERISVELSDTGAREIDEDEWTDRNCLASETSCAGGLSDDDESSSGEYADADAADSDCGAPETPAAARDDVPVAPRSLYFSDDSFGYDDYSDDGALSSGGESCSRMRAAREARRREVPADAPPPTDSSEVESEAESESSDEVSSATEVSTDSEFAREECLPAPSPPAILVTEAPPPAPPPPQDYPLSRTRSAGGLATKRALELKRRYLLGEPSPPAVRKSESTSQLDTKLEAFRFNITEFQKMLHPAPLPTPQPQKPIVTFQLSTDKKTEPMPDIIQNLRSEAPVDLLTKADSPPCKKEWVEETIKEENKEPEELESDSLSDDDSSHTETVPNQAVPRVEVHDEGGELIQLDSLMLIDSGAEDNDEKASGTATNTGPTVVSAESESSESCRDITTLALTETELSDWAAESAVLDDCNIDDKDDKKRSKNPRTLSGPKTIHDAKNISAISSHVCGRTSPTEAVVYSNALEHFEFVDEGDQDPSIETPGTPRNEGYMELVDDEYDPFSPSNDRSMNFIERSFSETMILPTSHDASATINERIEETSSEAKIEETLDLSSQVIDMIDKETSEKSSSDSVQKSDAVIRDIDNTSKIDDTVTEFRDTFSLSELSPPLEKDCTESIAPPKVELEAICPEEDASPPLAPETPQSVATTTSSNVSVPLSTPCTMRLYSPAICRSASETFNRSTSRSTDSPRSIELSMSINLSSGSVSPVSPTPLRNTTDKVQELKREREEQTEVVRRLVLERLGSGPRVARKSARRARISPSSNIPPPVPPPPSLPTPPPPPPPPVIPPPPPRPAPPLMPLPVTPSFSDPELARERRRKSIMRSISNYLNRRLGPRHKEPPAQPRISNAHKSTGALQEAPPVPPPPACYRPPVDRPPPVRHTGGGSGAVDVDERDAMQLWFEARWARLVAQRRAREEPVEPHARRVARLERRLTRPLSAEQQAATVAELVQVSAQREAHQALMAANRRRSGVSD